MPRTITVKMTSTLPISCVAAKLSQLVACHRICQRSLSFPLYFMSTRLSVRRKWPPLFTCVKRQPLSSYSATFPFSKPFLVYFESPSPTEEPHLRLAGRRRGRGHFQRPDPEAGEAQATIPGGARTVPGRSHGRRLLHPRRFLRRPRQARRVGVPSWYSTYHASACVISSTKHDLLVFGA